jgi:hypothetical protein
MATWNFSWFRLPNGGYPDGDIRSSLGRLFVVPLFEQLVAHTFFDKRRCETIFRAVTQLIPYQSAQHRLMQQWRSTTTGLRPLF